MSIGMCMECPISNPLESDCLVCKANMATSEINDSVQVEFNIPELTSEQTASIIASESAIAATRSMLNKINEVMNQGKNSQTTPLGMKFDSDKLDWSLLPIEPVEDVIRVLMYGATKYAPNNWLKVDDHERRYYNAAIRHITSWKKGEITDPETNLPHMAHAMCCLLFILGRQGECNGK